MDTGMKFNVVYGRELIGELKSICYKPLVVTMEELWDKFKHHFDGSNPEVYFVKTLEYDEICRHQDSIPAFGSVIGLGGGQALDVAKIFAWHTNVPLIHVPTSMGTNAAFTQRSGMRFKGIVKYIGFTIPQAVYVDYDVIKDCPTYLNLSGIGDAICYHTAIFDWKYAQDTGKCESKWPYDPDMAANSLRILQSVVDNIDDIKAVSDKGIKALMGAHADGGPIFHSYGWNPRYIEGVDHFLFYTLEYMTGKKFIHGQNVCLGIFTGSEMQGNRPDWILDVIYRGGVDIRPEAMDITWDDVRVALKEMKSHIKRSNLWYTVGSDFNVTDEFCDMVQEKVIAKYGPWKG